MKTMRNSGIAIFTTLSTLFYFTYVLSPYFTSTELNNDCNQSNYRMCIKNNVYVGGLINLFPFTLCVIISVPILAITNYLLLTLT